VVRGRRSAGSRAARGRAGRGGGRSGWSELASDKRSHLPAWRELPATNPPAFHLHGACSCPRRDCCGTAAAAAAVWARRARALLLATAVHAAKVEPLALSGQVHEEGGHAWMSGEGRESIRWGQSVWVGSARMVAGLVHTWRALVNQCRAKGRQADRRLADKEACNNRCAAGLC